MLDDELPIPVQVVTKIVTEFELVQPLVLVPTTLYEVDIFNVTVIAELVALVFQVYVFAPLAVKVAVCPKHTILALGVILIVGKLLTVTDCTAVFVLVQPAALVPVNEQEAVAVGENGTAFDTPPVQVQVLAPLPLTAVVKPEQITELVMLAVTVGTGFTLIANV